MKKQVKCLILGLFAAAFATACAKQEGAAAEQFDPAESCLYLTGEGTVTGVTVEKYDSANYTAEELKASTEGYLAEFNKEAERASLAECSLADGTARLQIAFADGTAYLDFMEMYPDEESSIQVTGINVVSMAEYTADEDFLTASFVGADNKAAEPSAVLKDKKLTLAAVEGEALIETDGAVKFVSDGVELLGNTKVKTAGNGVSYIVFQ